MHELGIVFHIIRSVEEVAAQNNLRRVSSVTLELGEVSGIIPSYLTDCWNWACAKNDLMRGAELVIEQIDAVTFCEACEQTYGTVEHGRTCPHCGGDRTFLVQGNETTIKEIATPDEEPSSPGACEQL
ncbi:MAG: hydrogenase maturation nickel metallochaperone HypA [Coriobacteriaceae bacterium]|nr:hydrogenase maturation nickel metallochaperone HypA [Coriobacteriaceae bacterium]